MGHVRGRIARPCLPHEPRVISRACIPPPSGFNGAESALPALPAAPMVPDGADGPMGFQLELTTDDWTTLLGMARFHRCPAGRRVIAVGSKPNGVMQVARGQLRIEAPVQGRPQDVVLGRLGEGETVGEVSFLLGVAASASVVCEAEALLIHMSQSRLTSLFRRRPDIGTKFYCFLATRQAERLRGIFRQTSSGYAELVLKATSKAPSTVRMLTANPAYLAIFDGFVTSAPDLAATFSAPVRFVKEVHALHQQPDAPVARLLLESIWASYLDARAPVATSIRQLLSAHAAAGAAGKAVGGDAVSTAIADGDARLGAVKAQVGRADALSAHELRHVYDPLLEACLDALEARCLPDFVRSRHYDYVRELRAQEREPPSHEHFQVIRKLGEGAFGTVLEVMKRDSGARYAMKVIRKEAMVELFGEDVWEPVVQVERDALARLQHPLLINLAYAFQTVDYLWLVTDLCDCGDLEPFGKSGQHRLSASQLRFVGAELAAVVVHLHGRSIMHRDLKPANALLDAEGHVRLADFGTAKLDKDDPESDNAPTSTEECGSRPYMAPEVSRGELYSSACDYFSLGVMLYEFCEKAWPFGLRPAYARIDDEFRPPDLLDEDSGSEVPHLYDLLTGLLDWEPTARLGGSTARAREQLLADPFWQNADWELVNGRRLPSPLAPYASGVLKGNGDEAAATLADRKLQEQLSDYSASVAQQQLLDQAEHEAGDSDQPNDPLVERAAALEVDEWDFVSSHALAQEYVRLHTDTAAGASTGAKGGGKKRRASIG